MTTVINMRPAATRPAPAVTCGQVWGTDCTEPVSGPEYVHWPHLDSAEIGPDCPVRVLAALSRSPDSTIRWIAARHPRCPLPALRSLACDGNYMVAWQASQHKALGALLHLP
jgi:hypothetical protein